MDQTVAERNDRPGGSKAVRPDRRRPTLIMDNFVYGRSEVPQAWGNFSGGPVPPTGTGSQIPEAWENFPGGPAPATGTGTFKSVWSKPNQPSRRQSRRPSVQKPCSFIDGQPWPNIDAQTTPGKPGEVIMIGGKPFDPSVFENPDEYKKIHEILNRAVSELGLDLYPPYHLSSEIPFGITYVTDCDRQLIVFQHRENLKYHEERFKRQYSYGTTAPGSSDPFTGDMELRHCLTGRSNDAFCWMEKSSGIKWVGIYGINSLCVVTLSGHVDWKRVHGGLATTDPKTVLSLFRKCVLSELEDLGDPYNKARRTFNVPFCVASATPDTFETPNESDVETSSVDYAAKAIDFVRSSGILPKVEDSGAAIWLAISAFERLIRKKCDAEEIEVTVVSGRWHGIPTVKDLDISEIDYYLDINNTTSEMIINTTSRTVV